MNNYDLALKYLDNGLSVIPIQRRGKRPDGQVLPLVEVEDYDGEMVKKRSWFPFQDKLPTKSDLKLWFEKSRRNIGIAAGKASGNLFVLDFDALSFLYMKRFKDALKNHQLGELLQNAPISSTGKGYHIYLRCSTEVPGNICIARTSVGERAIESRGHGGYVVTVGSKHPNGNWYNWIQGNETTIPILTSEQFQQLILLAGDLSKYDEKIAAKLRPKQFESRGIIYTLDKKGYIQSIVEREVKKVSSHPVYGRSNQLFASSAAIGRILTNIAPEDIDLIRDKLQSASRNCGIQRQYGERDIIRQINNGFRAGAKDSIIIHQETEEEAFGW